MLSDLSDEAATLFLSAVALAVAATWRVLVAQVEGADALTVGGGLSVIGTIAFLVIRLIQTTRDLANDARDHAQASVSVAEHERDYFRKELDETRDDLDAARQRVRLLERVIQKHGIDEEKA